MQYLFTLLSICMLPLIACVQNYEVSSPAGDGSQGDSMRALWTVSDFVLAPDSEWDKDQARKMLFRPLDMDDSSITFDGRSCQGITFSGESVRLESYLQQKHGISPDRLGLTDEYARSINTSCDLPGFSQFLRLSDRRLLVNIEGVFFFFNPIVTY